VPGRTSAAAPRRKVPPPPPENVWWLVRQAFPFPTEWTTILNRSEKVTFAWGPAPGEPLEDGEALEICISAFDGGQGTIWLDDVTFLELPATPPGPLSRRSVRISAFVPGPAGPVPAPGSAGRDDRPEAVLDGRPETFWRSVLPGRPSALFPPARPRRQPPRRYRGPASWSWRVAPIDPATAGDDDRSAGRPASGTRRPAGTRRGTDRTVDRMVDRNLDDPENQDVRPDGRPDGRQPHNPPVDQGADPGEADPNRAALEFDLGEPRLLGGLTVDWAPGVRPGGLRLLSSEDGQTWTRVAECRGTAPVRTVIPFLEILVRRLRLEIVAPPPGPWGIAEIGFAGPEAAAEPHGWYGLLAAAAPRGWFPRFLAGEQAFWSVVGLPDDDREALVSEDGAVETDRRAFSLEPFLRTDGRLLTWADATPSCSLADGDLPVPTVARSFAGLELTITALMRGNPMSSELGLRYLVTNRRKTPVIGDLFVALRPFQVVPPWQNVNFQGGMADVRRLAWQGREFLVDGTPAASFLSHPDAVGVSTFDGGDIVRFLADGHLPPVLAVDDARRRASGAARFAFSLQPGESREIIVTLPPRSGPRPVPARADGAGIGTALLPTGHASQGHPPLIQAPPPSGEKVRPGLARDGRPDPTFVSPWPRWLEETRSVWRERLDRIGLSFPAATEARRLEEGVRATLAQILVNRDGPSIQPGSRTYARSWARDGALTSLALLQLGFTDEAEQWVDWYGSFQRETGEIPCVIDARGPDPVPEHDSTGQYILAVANLYRFTGARRPLERRFESVRRAVDWLAALQARRLTPEFAGSIPHPTLAVKGKPPVPARAFRGLVPESISHEGYSAKPMHSYWDDFFVLRGLRDAAYIARALGKDALARAWEFRAGEFARFLRESLALTMRAHGIDYLPGCVELGDFDPTSTAIALTGAGIADALPPAALERTFAGYWKSFLRRRDDPASAWKDFTPYEQRVAGAFLALGDREKAHALFRYFFGFRRPDGWKHWAEVIWRNPREPRFLGDMPHTWVGSDFISSVRRLVVDEREREGTLHLLDGIPEDWLFGPAAGDGLHWRDLPTVFGSISGQVRGISGSPARGTVPARAPDGTRGEVSRVAHFGHSLRPESVVVPERLRISLSGRFRTAPARIIIRNPADRPFLSVTVNGLPGRFDAGTITVDRLPAEIEARY